jgi:molecular chaperone Hsp33
VRTLFSRAVWLAALPAWIAPSPRVLGFLSPPCGSQAASRWGARPRSSSSSAGGDEIVIETEPMGTEKDHMVSLLSGNGEVIVRALSARNLVQDALIKQDLMPLAADALGRVMVCTLLCSQGLKDEETLQFTFAGDGPLQGVMAISDGTGGVRGYVANPKASLDATDEGTQDVVSGIGKGFLKVVRNHPDYERPYNGIVEMREKGVAYDVAGYLHNSEQKSCAIAAGVIVQSALVRQAGGYLLETLPGASEATIKQCAENVGRLMGTNSDPSLILADGYTPAGIAEALLHKLEGTQSLSITPLEYKCHCSNERVFRALRLLGVDEVKDIIAKEENIEVKCEFCGKIYCMKGPQIAEELGI